MMKLDQESVLGGLCGMVRIFWRSGDGGLIGVGLGTSVGSMLVM